MIEFDKRASFFEEAFFNSTETYIHPTSIVGKHVKLDENVKIGPFCILTGDITIESGTRLHSYVTIGQPAQVRNLKESLGSIHIKKNCEIREYISIHASKYEDGKTIIGNNNYIMNFCHISHDCILADDVTLTNCVNLGGHTLIEKGVNLMANSATHQFCRIGQYAALGAYSGISQDLPPYCIFQGLPAKFLGVNVIGLRRAGFTRENINALRTATRLFYFERLLLQDLKQRANKQPWGQDPCVKHFITYIEESKRGVSRKTNTTMSKEKTL